MSSSSLTVDEITQCAGAVTDPEIGRTLKDLKMLQNVAVSGDNAIRVEVNLPTPAYPNRERIQQSLTASIARQFPDAGHVDVSFSSTVRGKDSGGSIGLRIKNVVVVGSGKGGVGKSTIATCLAYGLKSFGAKVGLMDADVYGPSIPHMLNASGRPVANEVQNAAGQKMMRMDPVEVDGLKLMSMGFFIEPAQAVVWRGPMLHKALTQFLRDTDWGELDYLIVDLPPGTGDVSLTLSQLLGLAGAVVVCTPQQVALLDAVKAIDMYRQVKVPILGMVENMSGEIFGRGGARQKAADMKVPFLGEIPIDATVRIRGDEGQMSALFSEDNPARQPLLEMCQRTAIEVARSLLETPKMPTLEIL